MENMLELMMDLVHGMVEGLCPSETTCISIGTSPARVPVESAGQRHLPLDFLLIYSTVFRFCSF